MADRIVLIGMMGAGKTTVGRLLADELGWRFVDSDEDIVARTGRTVREIFERDGEAAFRVLESDALRAALRHEHVVVGAAGGAVLDPENRRLLADSGKVIWLRAPIALLSERAGRGDHRPLLGEDRDASMTKLYAEREPLYASVADHTVDIDGRTPSDVVRSILEVIG